MSEETNLGVYEVTDAFVAALKEALDPVFEEQKETWAREGPAAQARAKDIGLVISSQGGNCPVQIQGEVDGKQFYFRARGEEYQVHIAATRDDIFDAPLHYVEREYGEGDYEAGWMPLHTAINRLCDEVEAWRALAVFPLER